MTVQCIAFSKSLNPRNVNESVSDIRIRTSLKTVLDIRILLQTHYPAGYPTGKPDSDHLCRLQIGKCM